MAIARIISQRLGGRSPLPGITCTPIPGMDGGSAGRISFWRSPGAGRVRPMASGHGQRMLTTLSRIVATWSCSSKVNFKASATAATAAKPWKKTGCSLGASHRKTVDARAHGRAGAYVRALPADNRRKPSPRGGKFRLYPFQTACPPPHKIFSPRQNPKQPGERK